MISLGTALAICGAAIAAALVRFSCFRPFLVRRAFTVY